MQNRIVFQKENLGYLYVTNKRKLCINVYVRRDRDHAHGCNRRARGHGRVLLQRRGLCGGFCRHRGYAYQQVWRERRGRGALPWCRLSLGLHHQTASVLRVAAGKALLFQQGGNRR